MTRTTAHLCGHRIGPRTRHRRPGDRAAFSLLEVLLALTLAVLLLGAIFTAMDQSWRLTSSGRHEMERAQLARALVRRITSDVRSIAFVPPLVVDSDEETASGSTTSESGSEEEEVTTRSFGLRGDTFFLEMQISRPRRDLEFSTDADGNITTNRTSDLRVVSYLHSGSPTGGTGAAAANSATAALGTGLIRTEGDRLQSLQIEEQGGQSTALSTSQVLAPEVNLLQFRYFDGLAWYTTWDSEQAGRLPRAVEVTLGFAPAASTGPALNVPVSASADQVRSVILLPIADPFPEEFLP